VAALCWEPSTPLHRSEVSSVAACVLRLYPVFDSQNGALLFPARLITSLGYSAHVVKPCVSRERPSLRASSIVFASIAHL